MIYDLVTKYGFNAPSLAAVKQLLWLALAHAPSDLANGVFGDSLPTMCSTNRRCDQILLT